MESLNIVECASDHDIARWLGDRLANIMARREGPATIAVPGGSTPFPIFEQLLTADLDFARLVVWPTDDRIVPETHEASNAGRIRHVFKQAGAEVASLSVTEQIPHFDLVWLGMGADGHIASLFPNTDPRSDDPLFIRRLTPDPLPPEAPFDRVTQTIPSLLNSDALMLVFRGDEKRAVLDGAIAGKNDLPIARLLRAARQPVTCFV